MQISHVSDDDGTFLDPLSARASVLKGLTWIKKEYKCKFCDKVFNHGYTRNRHEKVGIFFIYQGKCLKRKEVIVVRGPTEEVAPGRQQS